ncbi:hypothetical protein Rsub_08389 [Raphidocelis subcapitata]|uniref:SAP domain-containing protein n=1 Tax=Raphidocelis subcapitata TaxID=307507 RepID=A0A2V0PE25_9CHLO|nr:hypothetical protein Rsub_08389 [Raphidocelis subcapitata]|eukprot:GBF95427.1 hypothetical protein Rsub_08389 [Raphidocelis subcapitata]
MTPDQIEVDNMMKAMLLKDLRIQCRARGLSPAGGKEQLSERLKEHMLQTGDFSMKNENGEDMFNSSVAGTSSADMVDGFARNNYSRPEGQNVGNFLSDRNSSRVLAPPGGGSSIVFGDAEPAGAPRHAPPSHFAPAAPAAPAPVAAPAAPAPGALVSGFGGEERGRNNNYSRPGGQNVGNFLTDKSSSRVLAPPGGASSITFG